MGLPSDLIGNRQFPAIENWIVLFGKPYYFRNAKYQKLYGFGGAFTDAAGINIAKLSSEDHSPEDCPMVDIVNFRFGIFSSEPPKDL